MRSVTVSDQLYIKKCFYLNHTLGRSTYWNSQCCRDMLDIYTPYMAIL